MRVPQAGVGALPILWGDCIVHLSHPEFSGNILHTSGVVAMTMHDGFRIAETRNNYYALLGPEIPAPRGGGADPVAILGEHRCRSQKQDLFAGAAVNAEAGCVKCGGAGVYRLGEEQLAVCDRCCKHNQGWWLLEGGYGADNGRWACKMGCGMIADRPPPVLEFLPRAKP